MGRSKYQFHVGDTVILTRDITLGNGAILPKDSEAVVEQRRGGYRIRITQLSRLLPGYRTQSYGRRISEDALKRKEREE